MKFRDHFRDSELIFIAEIGINHNGDPASAKSLVDAAAGAGAHAVKFQTFVPELMYSAYASSLLAEGREVRKDPAQIDFFRKLALGKDDLLDISRHCRERNISMFSSPFDDLDRSFGGAGRAVLQDRVVGGDQYPPADETRRHPKTGDYVDGDLHGA